MGLTCSILIGKWEGKKSTMIKQINGFLEGVEGVKGTSRKANGP